MCWSFFQKVDLLFDYKNPGPNRSIIVDIRGQTILPIINTLKRDMKFDCDNHENNSTISSVLDSNRTHRKESFPLKVMASNALEFFTRVVFPPQKISFRFDQTHFGMFD